ncbi:uncharacterized protein J3D65DRAFT_270468 [Phyllosticta citribraziliensis]|uniref:Uncharacterized protein n=1 Tax=Phyllosticta citribraziliensis TaxID=989973 RepID=A0ABR1M158_9PEZI
MSSAAKMVDVQPLSRVHHPQWPLAKPYEQSRSSGSPASTPDLDDSERIRIAPSSTHQNPALRSSDALLHERYLSSEEDLSPTDRDSTESFELDEDDVEIMEAEVVSPRHSCTTIPSPCKVATAVSYVSAGRAKVVDLSESPTVREQTISVPSVANAVPILKSPVPRTSRMSFMAGHTPPASADRPNFSLRQDMRDVKAERRRTAMPTSQRPPLPKSPLVQNGDVLRPIPSTGSLRTTKSARHFSMAMAPSYGQFDRPRLMRSTTDVTTSMGPIDSNPGWNAKTRENHRRMQRASVMDLRSRRTPSPSKGRRSTEGEVGFARGEVEHGARMTPTPSTLSRSSTREQEPASPALERPPTISSFFRRPSSARSSYSQPPRSKRGSVLHIRQRSGSVHLPTFPSTTSLASTKSVKTPTFLDTDPFEKKEVSPKSAEGKPTHRRLRSISRTLTLAKMAVTPASKRDRSKSKSKSQPAPEQDFAILSPISPMTEPAEVKHSLYSPSPLGPSMPPTPVTPSTYSVSSPASSVYGRRSSSRMSAVSPPDSAAGVAAQRRKSSVPGKFKLVPRGADEREPPFELPPFPDELEPTGIQRKLRKRKSTLGFY